MNSKQIQVTPIIMGVVIVLSVAFLLYLAANAPKSVKGTETNNLDPEVIATEVGLDIDKFNTDRTSDTVINRVKEMGQEGRKIGLTSTPAVFLNGTQIEAYAMGSDGNLDYTPLFSAIEEAVNTSTDKVQLVEYFDYQCSYCAHLAPQIQVASETYQDRLEVTYMQYPILGENSITLAYAAEAAREQGLFSEYHAAMFDKYLQLITK